MFLGFEFYFIQAPANLDFYLITHGLELTVRLKTDKTSDTTEIFAPFDLWVMNLPSIVNVWFFKKEISYLLLIIYQKYVAQQVSLWSSLLRDKSRTAALMQWDFVWGWLEMFIQAK